MLVVAGDGNANDVGCVTDVDATSYNFMTIAAQCCDGTTEIRAYVVGVRRRTRMRG